MTEPVYSRNFYLAAGDGTPQLTLPVGRAIARCIEVATDHANLLGVGYENLHAHGQSWVLSRIVLEMESYPRVNETYTVETWVDNFNRAFSERLFRFLSSDGKVCGYARSTWVAIDVEKRTLADISRFDSLKDSITAARQCPIRPCGRHRAVGEGADLSERTFLYGDLDSNRHVNTVRYVEMLLDRWPLDFHDSHAVGRLEVSFMRECVYGETAVVAVAQQGSGAQADIMVNGERRVHFSVEFKPREAKI